MSRMQSGLTEKKGPLTGWTNLGHKATRGEQIIWAKVLHGRRKTGFEYDKPIVHHITDSYDRIQFEVEWVDEVGRRSFERIVL